MARKAGGPPRLAVAGEKAITPEKKNLILPAGAQLPGGRGMPEASRPKNGWPMRLAIFGLISERWQENARLYYDLEHTMSAELRAANPARQLLWNDLVEQAQTRPPALIFRGQRGGAVESINPELLSGALANFESDTIAAGEVGFHGVRVWPAAELQAREAIETEATAAAISGGTGQNADLSGGPTKKRRAPPVSYAEADRPLLEEMSALLANNTVQSTWQAALEVANKAKGGGQFESKARRLSNAFRSRLRTM